jgi:hypothetical protein
VEEGERALLKSLAEQVIEFVEPPDHGPDTDPLAVMMGMDPDAVRPDDPALARLLPDAYPGDEEASVEFRRYTERSLREQKTAHARAVLDALARSGTKVTLSNDELPSWLGFLNDARLALGVRMEITEENHDELLGLDEDDPRFAMVQVYDWLSYLQESLIFVLMPE